MSLTRRSLLRTGTLGLGATVLTTTLATPALASIGGGFCPPRSGGGGTGGGELGGGGGSVPVQDYTGAVPGEGPPTRSAFLLNPRNGETFNQVYVQNGQFVQSALEAFNWFARDWRHNDPTNMDPKLLDIIWALTEMLQTTAPWNMTSGYRNPASNATVGGARQSLHMQGKALDIGNPGSSHSATQGAARALARGGVGSYSSFTHVDTGAVRTWRG